VAQPADQDAEARRAYRHQLRLVARLLRWTGTALVVLGAAGIALGYPGAWFTGPSWFSFVLGCALVISGIVRRQAKASAVEPDE
jgi:hypothetical protein